MSRIVRHACVMVLWCAVLMPSTFAQGEAAGAAEEAEHEAIRRLKAIYETAVRDNSLDELGTVLHPDFHGVMITGRVVSGLEELKRYWADIRALMGEGGRYTTTLNPERSIIVGDVALARGTSDDVVVTDTGQEFRFTSLWTAVLQKENGRWVLRQAQGSMDPVDNAFTREFARRSLQVAVPVSAGIGVLLGLGIAWAWRRRAARRAG